MLCTSPERNQVSRFTAVWSAVSSSLLQPPRSTRVLVDPSKHPPEAKQNSEEDDTEPDPESDLFYAAGLRADESTRSAADKDG